LSFGRGLLQFKDDLFFKYNVFHRDLKLENLLGGFWWGGVWLGVWGGVGWGWSGRGGSGFIRRGRGLRALEDPQTPGSETPGFFFLLFYNDCLGLPTKTSEIAKLCAFGVLESESPGSEGLGGSEGSGRPQGVQGVQGPQWVSVLRGAQGVLPLYAPRSSPVRARVGAREGGALGEPGWGALGSPGGEPCGSPGGEPGREPGNIGPPDA